MITSKLPAGRVALVLLVLSAADAMADGRVGVRARPLPPPVEAGNGTLPWQGLYLGVSLGYGWGASDHEYNRNDNHGTASQTLSGGLGALTMGYNLVVSPSLLVGLEADIGVMDLTAADKVIFDGHVWKSQFGPFWGTLRARAGIMLGQTLLYGTAGLAFMDVDEVGIGDAAGQTAWNRQLRSGWALGAGAEHAISQRMTAKIEYLYMDFGRYEGLSENRETYAFDNSVSVVRAGLNFRF